MGMQAEYDGTAIDNGSWRTLVDGIGDSTGGEGLRVVTLTVSVEAADADSMNVRLLATRDMLLKRDKLLRAKPDTDAQDWQINMSPLDGIHTRVDVGVENHPDYEQTAYSRILLVSFIALIDKTFSPGGGLPSTVQTLAGVNDTYALSKHFSSSRIETRSLLIGFRTTYDDAASGPFTIASVEDDGSGNARFVFSGSPSLPALVDGMRLEVTLSAGNKYLGVHEITAIDDGTDKITTTTAINGTDTGTASVGDMTTADENRSTARGILLTELMGTNSDGSVSDVGAGKDGLFLVDEKIEETNGGSEATMLLVSQFQNDQFTTQAGVREVNFLYDVTFPDKWYSGGGVRPELVLCEGSISADVSTIAQLVTGFNSILTDLKTAIALGVGTTDLNLIAKNLRPEPQKGVLHFTIAFQTLNSTTRSFRSQENHDERPEFVTWVDSNGVHRFQNQPGPPNKIIALTNQRIGIGKVDIEPAAPVEAGFTFLRTAKIDDYDGPYEADFGDDIFGQSTGVAYMRLATESGGDGGAETGPSLDVPVGA